MPFALGVAIAALFQRIIDLLTLPPFPGYIPPGGGDDTPFPPGGGGGGDDDGGGDGGGGDGGGGTEEPPPQGPPPVVQEPEGEPLTPVDEEPDEEDCPNLSYADRLALYALQYRTQEQESTTVATASSQYAPEEQMLTTLGLGTPLDANDRFRFRAISTNDNVPVSFFGRIQTAAGEIIPFIRVLNTSTANTIFETTAATGPGLLLGAAASVPIGSITTGAVNAIGEIGRVSGDTFTPHTVLFSGQVDDQQALDSNLATPSTPVGRPTFLGSDDAASVASPKNIIITPPSGKRVRITRVFGQFTTDATVLGRAGFVAFLQGGVSHFRSYGADIMLASQAGQLNASIGGSSLTATNDPLNDGPVMQSSLPETLYYYEAVTVQLGIQNGSGGDRISSMLVRYEVS